MASQSQKFGPLLILSLFAAFLSPIALLRVQPLGSGIALGLSLFLMWLGLLIFAVRKFRKKGLWLLVGSPIAVLFPLFSIILIVSK